MNKNKLTQNSHTAMKIENWGGLEYVTVKTHPSRVTSYGPTISAEKMHEIDKSVAVVVIKSRHPIRGKELQFIRKACGISLRQLAVDFQVSHPTIMNWEKSENRLDRTVEAFVRLYFGEKMGEQLSASTESLAPTELETDEIQLIA